MCKLNTAQVSDKPTISLSDAESLELSSIQTVTKPSHHIPGDGLRMECGSMADVDEGTSVSCDDKKPVNPSKVKTSKMSKKKVKKERTYKAWHWNWQFDLKEMWNTTANKGTWSKSK